MNVKRRKRAWSDKKEIFCADKDGFLNQCIMDLHQTQIIQNDMDLLLVIRDRFKDIV